MRAFEVTRRFAIAILLTTLCAAMPQFSLASAKAACQGMRCDPCGGSVEFMKYFDVHPPHAEPGEQSSTLGVEYTVAAEAAVACARQNVNHKHECKYLTLAAKAYTRAADLQSTFYNKFIPTARLVARVHSYETLAQAELACESDYDQLYGKESPPVARARELMIQEARSPWLEHPAVRPTP